MVSLQGDARSAALRFATVPGPPKFFVTWSKGEELLDLNRSKRSTPNGWNIDAEHRYL